MDFAGETILFAAYSGVAALLAIATGMRAATSGASAGGGTRVALVLASALLLPAFACAALSTTPGLGPLWRAWFALPLLALVGVLSGLRLWSSLGFGGKLFTSATVAWNGCLCLFYALHVLTEFLHVELGAASALPLAVQGLAQGVVGAPGAEAHPHWLWLPLLLPPQSEGDLALSARALAGAAASAMLGVTALAVPAGLAIVGEIPPAQSAKTAPRGDIESSIRIGTDTWGAVALFDDDHVQADIDRAVRELGVRELVLSIRADLVEDDARISELVRAAQAVRAHERRVAVRVTTPPPGAVPTHPRLFAERMQNAHWIVMERVAPDLLILFDRPIHERTRALVSGMSSRKWIEIIRASVRQIAEGKPKQRCAVTLEPSHPMSREIWTALASGRGPHEIRFRIEGKRHDVQAPERACLTLEGWLAECEARVPITVVASAPSPVSFGGHDVMERYYRELLTTASKHRHIAKVCLGDLRDHPSGRNGLWSIASKPRPVVARVLELLREIGVRARPRPAPRPSSQ